jgi:hypothetical protein
VIAIPGSEECECDGCSVAKGSARGDFVAAAIAVLIGSPHVKVCDETCGFGIPTKEDMIWLADYAMSVDPKYANGLVYFLYHEGGTDPGTFIGIQDEPAIAQSVTAINRQREFWPSLFPVRIPK